MLVKILTLSIAVVTFFLIIMMIRSSKMQIRDSIFWIIWSISLSLFSIFSNRLRPAFDNIGIHNSAGIIFLLFTIYSYLVIFHLYCKVSQLSDKSRELTQIIAINQLEQKKSLSELKERHEELQKYVNELEHNHLATNDTIESIETLDENTQKKEVEKIN